MRYVAICVLSLATLLADRVATAVVIYDESVSGDLPNIASSAPVFSFVAGSNQILGTESVSPLNPLNPPDFDAFRFFIPVDMSLTSATLSASVNPMNPGGITGLGFRLACPS